MYRWSVFELKSDAASKQIPEDYQGSNWVRNGGASHPRKWFSGSHLSAKPRLRLGGPTMEEEYPDSSLQWRSVGRVVERSKLLPTSESESAKASFERILEEPLTHSLRGDLDISWRALRRRDGTRHFVATKASGGIARASKEKACFSVPGAATHSSACCKIC